MPELKLSLFGDPQLEARGRVLRPDRRKALALLAYLALAEQRHSRDRLAALLWPNLNEQRARAALRSAIYALSELAPGSWLDKRHNTLALDHGAIAVDVREFVALLARSRAHPHPPGELCPACVEWLSRAVSLYGADFMAGFAAGDSAEYDDWQLLEREWLRRELAHALARLADHFGAARDFGAALDHARRWLALDPLHEPAHRALMRLYAASGQRAAALRQYRACADLLQSELATTPEDETTRLYLALQADGGSLGAAPAAAQPATGVLPPLPALIVGRERALADVRGRLGIPAGAAHPVTVVQGWPGVGKSTLAAALAHDAAVAAHYTGGVLWTSLGEAPNLLSELAVWAESLGVYDRTREHSLESLSAQLAAALRERRALLVIDDAWRVERAAPFKVGGPACATVITSRLNEVAQALAPAAADVYRLTVLDEEPALDLLGRLAPETVANHPKAARDLVRDLEGLPLAIQVAGRLLHGEARLGWGVAELLAELRGGAKLLEARAPSDMARLGQTTTPTVAALLTRSTDALDAATRERFAVLGVFVPKPATFDLGALAAAWDLDDPRPVARVLVNRGLLEPVGGGRFQLHALLVLHARALLSDLTADK